jgi:hypothetical protein
MAETAREVLEKTKSIMAADSISQQRTKATVSGAFLGMATGLLIGYSRKYSLGPSALFGAMIGVLAVQLILPKNK